jgi:ubiquinone/menaquinone biosynthesis C-methylase UbiE
LVEKDRLQVQARLWEPDAEAMLDEIGLARGARCVDLGCGAMGILGPLARRVGPEGKVYGVEMDARSLDGAAEYVKAERLPQVELREGDAFATGLPAGSFDLVHARLLLAPVGHHDDLLAEMLRLVKPGGVVAVEEPEPGSWHFYPRSVAFETLKEVMDAFLTMTGGDPSAGQKVFQMLRRAGLKGVKARSCVRSVQDAHPYMRMVIQGFTPLRAGVVDALLISERELDRAIADLEERIRDPDTRMTTFTLTQAWGTR